MSIKIKDSGSFKEPIKISVKDGGSWKEVLTGSVKDGGSWKEFYQRKFTYTVSSDVNKLDLDTQEILEAAGTKWNFLRYTNTKPNSRLQSKIQ